MYYGIWIMAQSKLLFFPFIFIDNYNDIYSLYILTYVLVAQKTGLAKFNSIIFPFMLFWFICFVISLVQGLGWVYILPGASAALLSLWLRFHVINTYQIQSNCFIEFLSGFFCFTCSIAQSKCFILAVL